MALDAWVTVLLVFARLAAALMWVPVLSARGVPRHVPVLLAVLLTVLVGPHAPLARIEGPVALILAVGLELLYGSAAGLGLAAVFASIALAAEVSSQQTGLAMMTIFDPVLKTQEGPLGVLAAAVAGWVFLASGLHREVLLLLAGLFAAVPPGTAAIGAALIEGVAAQVARSVVLGVQLAGPVVVLVFLVNAFVGVLTRLAPRMNVFFSVGMSVTGAAGVALFALALPWFIEAHHAALRDAIRWMAHALGAG